MNITFPGSVSTLSPYLTRIESNFYYQSRLLYDLRGNQLKLNAEGHVLSLSPRKNLRFSDSEQTAPYDELTILGRSLVEQLRSQDVVKTICVYSVDSQEEILVGLTTPLPKVKRIYDLVQFAASIIRRSYTPRGIPDVLIGQ